MAITFLTAVNDTLKLGGVIQGTAGELASFTDASRQTEIDVMIRSWNEVIHDLRTTGVLKGETASGTITLAAADYDYSLASDFEIMVGDPIDSTNANYLHPYPGGWLQLRYDRPDRTDFEGLPYFWAINPNNGLLEIDTSPTSNEAGRAYSYIYEKAINLTAAADTFPFTDTAVYRLYDAVVEKFNLMRKDKFRGPVYQASLARAAHFARQLPRRSSWGPGNAAGR